MSDRSYQRNTSKRITVNYNPLSGVAGSKLFFTVKSEQYDANATDTSALIKQTVNMTANVGVIELVPTTLADSVEPGNYYYDMAVLDTDGDIYVIDYGRFEITALPTNREA